MSCVNDKVCIFMEEYMELVKQADRVDLLESIRTAQGEMIRKLQDENLKMKKQLQEVLPPQQPSPDMFCINHPTYLRPCPVCHLGYEAEKRIKEKVERILEERGMGEKNFSMVEEESTRLDCGNPDCPKCHFADIDPAGEKKDKTGLVYETLENGIFPVLVMKVDGTVDIDMPFLFSEWKKWVNDPTVKIKEVKKATSPVSQSISGSAPIPVDASTPQWTCEFCYTQSFNYILPSGWQFIWESAICPDCYKIVAKMDNWINKVNGGAFSGGMPDPRKKKNKPVSISDRPRK